MIEIVCWLDVYCIIFNVLVVVFSFVFVVVLCVELIIWD